MSATVVIAESHSLIRAGLRAVLSTANDLLIIGEAEDGATALQMAERLKPDVLMINVNLSDMTGLEVTRRLTSRESPVGVLVLSPYNEKIYSQVALSIGARGCVNLDAPGNELIQAVQSAASAPSGAADAVVEDALSPDLSVPPLTIV